MDTWSLPKARPISCNDCPAFQRLHMSLLCIVESFTRRCCVINTTFSEKIYIRWCCIDRLSWQGFSETSPLPPSVASLNYIAIHWADPSHFVTFRIYTALPAAAPEAQAH